MQYYLESHAVIYIVDSSDRDRVDESKEAFGKKKIFFFKLTSNPKLWNGRHTKWKRLTRTCYFDSLWGEKIDKYRQIWNNKKRPPFQHFPFHSLYSLYYLYVVRANRNQRVLLNALQYRWKRFKVLFYSKHSSLFSTSHTSPSEKKKKKKWRNKLSFYLSDIKLYSLKKKERQQMKFT